MTKAFFDWGTALEAPHLWIELDGAPPTVELPAAHPKMFKQDGDRILLDLTAYICLLHDIRRV